MNQRPAFSAGAREPGGRRATTQGARLSVSPNAFEGKELCAARKVDGARCGANPAKGTPYCIGHGRSLGVIVLDEHPE